MKTVTESNHLTEPRKSVHVYVGDKVTDIYGYSGIFTVQEIREDGWVWGEDMKYPYKMNKEKNFIDNSLTWKI